MKKMDIISFYKITDDSEQCKSVCPATKLEEKINEDKVIFSSDRMGEGEET